MATVSQNYHGDPELGPEIYIEKSNSTKPRVLLGWIHNEDTPEGLKEGKLWCWTSEGNHFQVFDENFNHSTIPGDVRDCGVANFTMVRMFHPYWLKNGRIPQDMVSADKRECREKYRALLSQRTPNHPLNNLSDSGSSGDSDDSDDSDDDERNSPPAPPQTSLPRRTGLHANRGRRPTLPWSPNTRRDRRQPSTGLTKERPYFIDDSNSDSDIDLDKKIERNSSPTMKRLLAGLTGRRAGFRNTDTVHPVKNEKIDDLTDTRPSPLFRSSVARGNSAIKNSPRPAFSTELLRNLPALDRMEKDPASSDLQFEEPDFDDDRIRRNNLPILQTIETDEMDVKQEERAAPVRRRNDPVTIKPIVIELDDSY